MATLLGFGLIGILLLIILWKLFTQQVGSGQGSDSKQLEQLRMELSRLDGAIRAQLQSTENQLGELRKTVTHGLQSVNETLDKKLLQVINESRTDREALTKSQLEAGSHLKNDVNAMLTTMSKSLHFSQFFTNVPHHSNLFSNTFFLLCPSKIDIVWYNKSRNCCTAAICARGRSWIC